MSTLSIPYSFTDGTTIVAAQQNANFNAVKAFVDALSAGDNFDTGAIDTTSIADSAVTGAKIAANAVDISNLATAVANALVPVGTVVPYGGSTAPNANWLIADGSALSRTTYSTLFGVLGTSYGSGDGSTTFNIPNLKGKVAVGYDSTQTEFDTLGETGGTKTVTLTEGQLPIHTHANAPVLASGTVSITDPGHTHTSTMGSTNLDHRHSAQAKQGTASMAHNGTTTFAVGGSPNTGEVYPNTSFAESIVSGSMNHSHSLTIDSSGTGISATVGTSITANNASVGSGEAHNNLQPYQVLNYIIKAS